MFNIKSFQRQLTREKLSARHIDTTCANILAILYRQSISSLSLTRCDRIGTTRTINRPRLTD